MYISNFSISYTLAEANLSIPWSVSTATLGSSTGASSYTGLFSAGNGRDFFLTRNGSRDDVVKLLLSSDWDIAGGATLPQSISVASQQTNPSGVFFKPDGTKMFVVGLSGGGKVTEYTVSNPFDLDSTVTFVQNFVVGSQESGPTDVFFKPDGRKMYVIGFNSDAVHEYDLSTSWDISTSVHLQSFSVAGQTTSPQGLFFRPDGKKMYVVGAEVYEYDLG
jgi:DNA-binding beta-propeller fold protein YncE